MSALSELYKQALEVRRLAYVPYSKFAVGAALLTPEGKIYTGCNVENVSYPCGTCAEAGAIAAMHAGGDKIIKEMVVVADGENLITPCGACLQRIFEFADENAKVHLADLEGIKKTYKISELLPLVFNEKELRK